VKYALLLAAAVVIAAASPAIHDAADEYAARIEQQAR
jgi:hypothetical protein